MAVYLRLQGPGASKPKAPIKEGWQSPGERGMTTSQLEKAIDNGTWVGLRTDPFVVIDCDNDAARDWWLGKIGRAVDDPGTWLRKTPNGWHFIYSTAPGAPEVSHTDVLDASTSGIKVDILAGRQRQIVVHAPGYADAMGTSLNNMQKVPVDKLPAFRTTNDHSDEEWDEMPDGRANNTLTAIAGTMRKQGASYEVILRMLLAMNKLTMTTDPMPVEQVDQIARSVSRYDPLPDIDIELVSPDDVENQPGEKDERDNVYMRASHLKPVKPRGWLWEPYLPLATFVSVEGSESVGKGMFVTWIAQKVASGEAFPAGHEREPGVVLWYSAEDDPQEEIMPRLRAAGWTHEHAEVLFFNQDHHQHEPHLPKDIEQMRKMVVAWNVKLLVLDVTRDFLYPEEDGQVKSNNDEAAIRPGLRALLRLATQTGCTIIGPHHTNKIMRSDASSRERSSGSGAFRQVPRLVIKMEQVADQRAFAVDKANNSEKMHTVFAYDIITGSDPEDGTPTGVFEPGGKLSHRTIDEWRQDIEALEAEGAYSIPLDNGWFEAAYSFRQIERGGPAPVTAEVARRIGVDMEAAAGIILAWKQNNVIDNNGHWIGRE